MAIRTGAYWLPWTARVVKSSEDEAAIEAMKQDGWVVFADEPHGSDSTKRWILLGFMGDL
jgi:hypothetical protein